MLARSPERVAWITLIVAQIICLLTAAVTLTSGWWFFFGSSVGLQTHLQVGRGTIIVANTTSTNEEAVRIGRDLNTRNLITTDQDSQGTIQFIDDQLVVASVTVFSNSQVQIINSKRPRFPFSEPDYSIKLSDIRGHIEIQIPPDLPQKLTITAQGSTAEVTLEESGFYVIVASDENTRILPREGNAQLRPYRGELTHVPTQHEALVDISQQTVSLYGASTEIIQNPRFTHASEPGFPDQWGCRLNPETPRGEYQLSLFEGRRAVNISRVANGHGRVGCIQILDGGGLDVTGYRHLQIRATLEVVQQSLTICGSDASECPITLALTYYNEFGDLVTWYHGFYAFEYPGVQVERTTCSSCLDRHDRITPGHWYTYESANLFELPPGWKPTRIVQVEFYSSGHTFEVNVAEVGLVGES